MTATIDLNLVRAFVGVHETGSFSGAASRLGVPRSTVSRAVSALEASAGVQLFHRTTRKVTTTTAGLQLFDRVAPSLSTLEGALTGLADALETPSGTLRITTSPDLGTTTVAETVAAFTARYPEARVEVHLGSAVVDLVRERFDLALRFARGRLGDSSLIARKVGDVTLCLYAAPSYLARRGAPRHVEDLAAHDWVALPGSATLGAAASLSKRSGARVRTTCDDKFFAREVLRAGGGIGLLPSYFADPDVAEGRLVRVLPRSVMKQGAVYLLWPSQKLVPRRVSVFRELLLEAFRQRPLTGAS